VRYVLDLNLNLNLRYLNWSPTFEILGSLDMSIRFEFELELEFEI
jgi:hypothetical protein